MNYLNTITVILYLMILNSSISFSDPLPKTGETQSVKYLYSSYETKPMERIEIRKSLESPDTIKSINPKISSEDFKFNIYVENNVLYFLAPAMNASSLKLNITVKRNEIVTEKDSYDIKIKPTTQEIEQFLDMHLLNLTLNQYFLIESNLIPFFNYNYGEESVQVSKIKKHDDYLYIQLSSTGAFTSYTDYLIQSSCKKLNNVTDTLTDKPPKNFVDLLSHFNFKLKRCMERYSADNSTKLIKPMNVSVDLEIITYDSPKFFLASYSGVYCVNESSYLVILFCALFFLFKFLIE